MQPLKSWAVCIAVCAFLFGMVASPAVAEGGWGDNGQRGKPDNPPHESVAPTYYGQPMAMDDTPWNEDRGKKKGPDFESSSPLAWWMQMAVDDNPWNPDPPRKNRPKL